MAKEKEKERKPAHEAILDIMEAICPMLNEANTSKASIGTTEIRIDILSNVLIQMIIPEKELSKVISALEQFKNMAIDYGNHTIRVKLERTIKLIEK